MLGRLCRAVLVLAHRPLAAVSFTPTYFFDRASGWANYVRKDAGPGGSDGSAGLLVVLTDDGTPPGPLGRHI